jgi:hypothetical protein
LPDPFYVESAAARAQCGLRTNHEDRTRSLSDFMTAHSSLEIAPALDGDRKARAYPGAAQLLGKVARAHGRVADAA